MQRGEVWFAATPGGDRPVLVLTRDPVAGRVANVVVAADENVNAYGLPVHRHVAEMDQELAALGAPVAATFVPHLVPLDQGELSLAAIADWGPAEDWSDWSDA